MMKHINEYRDKKTVAALVEAIRRSSKSPVTLMEVCGGHTMSIQKFGIPSLLPETVNLISGPGCPVCVTDRRYIDTAIALSRLPDVVIATYGDLIRVPGSSSSLEKERAAGRRIMVVYSVLDAIKFAEANTSLKVVFLGIGFETTTPSSAVGILTAKQKNLRNFFVYSTHKVMPPAMAALIDEEVKIDGYIGPGHVTTITGTSIYDFIPEKYGLGVVISGFEPVDLLQSILMLVRQFEEKRPAVEIQYRRVVKPEGNIVAREKVNTVFRSRDDWWRGLGVLPESGLAIRDEFSGFDAEKNFNPEVEPVKSDGACICGSVLKGIAKPVECKLFGTVCNPADPVGPCMVSSEGACHAYYKYQSLEL
jgi:hydrogenase expression/formation protein HypD